MRRIEILFIITILTLELSGQVNKYGVPVIRNYDTQITPGSGQNWCITKDNSGNIYFGNQDRGVIKYDGTNWSQINIGKNPRVFSLESDSRGIIYVGSAFEFGYIQPGLNGKPEYVSLASRIDSLPEIKIVYSILVEGEKVLFQSAKSVYVYDITTDSLTKIDLLKYGIRDALRLVRINDKLILADNVLGLFELKDTVVTPIPGGDFFARKPCTVLFPFDDSNVLVGTFSDGLYLFDYKSGTVNKSFIEQGLNEKLKDVKVYSGTLLADNLFAFGTTVELGVLIFNKSGVLLQQVRNENSALEDNTIIALYCDYKKKSELWISTQGFISKAYINIPVTYFSEKQGIEAEVNSIAGFNGNLYLGNDAGVYKSTVNKNNEAVFAKIPGTNDQVFPLEVIKSGSGDFLLAGSLNSLLQIMKSDNVREVEKNCSNIPPTTFKFDASEILQSVIDPSVVYLGQKAGDIIILKLDGQRWKYYNKTKKLAGSISGLIEKKSGGLWVLTDDPSALYSVDFRENDSLFVKCGLEKGIQDVDLHSIHVVRDQLYVTSSSGILKYDQANDMFVSDNSLTGDYSFHRNSTNIFDDPDGDIWYSGIDKNVEDILFRNSKGNFEKVDGMFRILPNIPLMDIIYSEGRVYILKSKSVFVVDKSSVVADTTRVKTSFVSIVAGADSVVMNSTFYTVDNYGRRFPSPVNPETAVPEYGFDMNDISFQWTTPSYTEELFTEYSYKLEGFEKEWSKWEGISFGNTMVAQYSKKEYSNLPYGRYTFKVKTRTLTGQEGNELSYQFIILKPWYFTIFAFIGFFVIALLIIIAIIKAYTKKLKNENIRLEGIVAERTAVVVKQKEELESSIHYASRIQMALLPSETILSENIKNYFVLFKPRDIVSGDFYWMIKKAERLYIVAGDCTGHGVPGAFMSLLGMSFLDEIIDKEFAPRADEILNELRLHVTESLKQVGDDDEAKDGMDLALLVIDFGKQKIEFSGAYNPCFRVRKLTDDEIRNYVDDQTEKADGSMSNGKYLLETIYSSKMPIGISSRMNEAFVLHDWALQKGVSYYLFSDGYIDQFGGPYGRKFMKKNFKRLILDIQDYPMQKQKELLDKNLIEWMGHSPQIDDILVMGLRTE